MFGSPFPGLWAVTLVVAAVLNCNFGMGFIEADVSLNTMYGQEVGGSVGFVGYKGTVVHWLENPWELARQGRCGPHDEEKCDHEAIQVFDDGLLIVDESGHVHQVGDYDSMIREHQNLHVVNYTGNILMPGFVDGHIHYPQTGVIASWGDDLIEWLHKYTYPEEASFHDKLVAKRGAREFINNLLKAGTTSALVYSVIFKYGVDAFFEEASSRKMRVLSGLNGMSNCDSAYRFNVTAPEGSTKSVPLCNSEDEEDVLGIESSKVIQHQTKELIAKWHNRGRIIYTVMPRFLTTATPASLETYVKLLKEAPNSPEGLQVRFHTHANENLETSLESITNFKKLAIRYYNGTRNRKDGFLKKILQAKTQLEIFDLYGLVTSSSSFAHNIHLTYKDYEILSGRKASSCHCPTSNLFLGSGFFDIKNHIARNVSFGIGTDVGGGTSFSLVNTLGEVYKVGMIGSLATMQSNEVPMWPNETDKSYYFPVKEAYHLSPLKHWFLLTLGGAQSLGLEQHVGNFATGKEADFVVLDWTASSVLRDRIKRIGANQRRGIRKLEETLFAIQTLAQDNIVKATYVMGKCQYLRHDKSVV